MLELTKYTGTKTVQAKPMTRGEHSKSKGFEEVLNGLASDEGYQVIYSDGYESWSPKETFEESYREHGSTITFGQAVEALRAGQCIARKSWNYAGVFVFKQVPSAIKPEIVERMTSLPDSVKEILIDRGEGPNYVNQMAIVDTDSSVDSWLPTAEDMFADDWFVI